MIAFMLAVLMPSLLLAWMLGFAIRKRAPKLGLIDRPGHRKVHTEPTPLGGGIAIWAGVVLPCLLGLAWVWFGGPAAWVDQTDQLNSWQRFVLPHIGGIKQQTPDLLFLLGCGTALMLLGLADDRKGLDWRLRFAIQWAVAASIVFWRGWKLTLFFDVPVLTGFLSVMWIVGLINSFNMLDNMDGLSAGVGAICAVMFAAVLLIAPDPESNGPQLFVAGLLLLLAGSLLGFLWHNRPVARLFMGDAGSYFVGFMLAVCTLLGTFAGGILPKHAILAPLCVLALPLYDTVSVVLIRLKAGRSPFEGDKNHLSHRLVDLGLTKPQAVLTICLATTACGLSSLVLHQVDTTGAILIVLSILCLLAVIAILETTARRKQLRDAERESKQRRR